MRKIMVITTTRAEYGLLTPIMKKIVENPLLELQLVISGTHLMKEFGYTKKEIMNDGFKIDKEIDWELHGDKSEDISYSMGIIMIKFSKYIKDHQPDFCILLGDRFEMLSFASVLVNFNIPIAHINGGETTEGAIDECYRHALTKMSTLHFPNCELHKNRIIQMGEDPKRVFNVGDLSNENINMIQYINRKDLEEELKLDLSQNIVVTYHPVTTENNSLDQLNELLKAIDTKNQYSYVITKANADSCGMEINKRLDDFSKNRDNIRVVDSLGMVKFLSLLKYSKMMLGNSSSGIYEAPLFHIPTINIGNRQKGRLMPDSVINCNADAQSIIDAINYGFSINNQLVLKNLNNQFYQKSTSDNIIFHIVNYLTHENKCIKKKFYEIKK